MWHGPRPVMWVWRLGLASGIWGYVAPAAAYDVGIIYQGSGFEGSTPRARCMLDWTDTALQTDILSLWDQKTTARGRVRKDGWTWTAYLPACTLWWRGEEANKWGASAILCENRTIARGPEGQVIETASRFGHGGRLCCKV